MKKNNECNIVQDLLFGYVDNILNQETRIFVENHIKNCNNCKLKLEEIKSDNKNLEMNQKKEIDYLKKIRRKSIIRSIIFTIIIILLIVFFIFLKKFIIINNIVNNETKSMQSKNFYKEDIQIFDEETAVYKVYFKDGKYKTVSQKYSDSGIKTESISFSEINKDEITYVDLINNKVQIKKGEIIKRLNTEDNIKQKYFRECDKSLLLKLGMIFVMDISKDTYEYGKEYYVFKNLFENNQRWEMWIDKDTGLRIKEINRDSNREFYPESTITKSIKDNVIEFRYDFNIVTDEDVEPIDISGYEIEYLNIDNQTFDE